VILAYTVANQKQLRGIVSLIKDMSEEHAPVTHSTHCTNKALSWSRSNGDLSDLKMLLTVLVNKLK
jgi:hypothetical protein